MDSALIGIALLGLGALLISVYIFTVSARHFVSEDEACARHDGRPLVPRQESDRRQSAAEITFPAIINGVLVREDRRQLPDRRRNVGQCA